MKINFPLHHFVTLCMGFFIFLTLVQGVMLLKQTSEKMTPVVSSIENTESLAPLMIAIPEWHLFGQAPATLENLAKTQLQLELNGILLGKSKERSYAIISERGKEQKLYQTGDNLPGGAVLYQIESRGIIIQYNGELQQLPLLKTQSPFA